MEDLGDRSALVVGAGIGGLAAAVALQRAGWTPLLLERAPRIDPLGAGISLWPNAVHCLRRLGLGGAVAELPPVHAGSALRTWRGDLLSETDPVVLERRFGAPMVLLHRARLHELLLGGLAPTAVRLDAVVVAVEQDAGGVTAHLDDGSAVRASVLVGADGVRSAVRQQLLADGPPRYAGYTAWRAVVRSGTDGLPLGELWGPGAVFGLVPLAGGDLYWFATGPAPAGEQDDPAERKADVLRRLTGWHPALAEVVRATPAEAVLRHDVVDRLPRRGWSRGRTTLLGDAAHPMTPHLGQGACQALEDAVVLADCLETTADVPAALARYEDRRFRRTATLVHRSRQLGRLAQLRSPVLRHVRDAGLRRVPAGVALRRLDPFLRGAAQVQVSGRPAGPS